jgi:hypothetical protein
VSATRKQRKGAFKSFDDVDHLDLMGFSGEFIAPVNSPPRFHQTGFGKGLENVGDHVAGQTKELRNLLGGDLLSGASAQAG